MIIFKAMFTSIISCVIITPSTKQMRYKMARTDDGVKLLKEKATELAKLKALVNELAEDNEFTLESDEYSDGDMYSDWHNSSCYGEESGDDFGVSPEGNIWYPSSC